jgi:hypothetical protein
MKPYLSPTKEERIFGKATISIQAEKVVERVGFSPLGLDHLTEDLP